jgi:3-oxoacyl-[acyl-carrier protein] reductase
VSKQLKVGALALFGKLKVEEIMGTLDGKVALITGAARGLGRAFSHRLSAQGAKIAVIDISLKSYQAYAAEQAQMTAEDTVAEIRAKGGEAIGIEADVSNEHEIADAVTHVAERFGRIDIGICNAGGGTGPAGALPAHEIAPDVFRAVTERNHYGTVFTCQPLAKVMIKQGSGKIITLSSMAGVLAYDVNGGYADYGAAKAAIAMYTRYLARSLGRHGITANSVAPGYTATARLVENFKKMGEEEIKKLIPLGRYGTPDDCAGLIEFLSSPASDYITGQVIAVDGGVTVFAK